MFTESISGATEQKLVGADEWEVRIYPASDARQSMFLHDGEAIGYLWFEGTELIDYDGVFSLPKEVEKILRDAGYTLQDAG